MEIRMDKSVWQSNWLAESFVELAIELKTLFSHITQFQIGQIFYASLKSIKDFGCRFDEAEMMALVFFRKHDRPSRQISHK